MDRVKQNADGTLTEIRTIFPRKFKEESRADQELGGSAKQWEHTLHHCCLALIKYKGGDMIEFLSSLHLAYHPSVMRFLSRVGSDFCEECLAERHEALKPELKVIPGGAPEK